MSIREPAYRCRLTKFKAASLSFLPWTLHSPLQPGFSLPLPNWFNDEIEKWRFFSKISKHEPLCYNLETLRTRNTEEKTPEVESPRHASRRIKTHTCSPRREFLVTRISPRINNLFRRTEREVLRIFEALSCPNNNRRYFHGNWRRLERFKPEADEGNEQVVRREIFTKHFTSKSEPSCPCRE